MAHTSEARELQAERELGHTEIGRGLAIALTAAFLVLIAAVPAVQLAVRPPDARPLAAGVPSECTLERFERGLEDDSAVGGWLLPRLQLALTRALGLGNEQVYPGTDGWLFHRQGVDYVTGRGFLDPAVLDARRRAADACDGAPEPDPLGAIQELHDQLSERGIQLLVVPTPVKAVTAPEKLAGGRRGPLQNPSFGEFLAALEARGIAFLDPTPLLLEPGSYLASDTHWRPEAMERVAQALAERLEGEGALAPQRSGGIQRSTATARHFGDLTLLLNLPAGQSLYPPESVTIRPVSEDGAPWRARRGAELLLLGDSFSNVYSDRAAFQSERAGADLHWGQGAGLAEQLSYFLGRPVDRIVRNAGGAHAARADLAREVARDAEAGADRLAGVRVVVWQFAVRELAQGDWKRIALAAAPRGAPSPRAAPAAGGASRLRATLAARAEAPRPGSVPYRDALIALHLRDVETREGEPLPAELLVYAFGMRDDRWTEAARLAAGTPVELRVLPLESEAVQERVGSLNRVELDDLELLALPAFFGELLAPGGDPP
jgi:alginate O-acetyltransferase complex protein AlgJ